MDMFEDRTVFVGKIIFQDRTFFKNFAFMSNPSEHIYVRNKIKKFPYA